MEINKKLSWRKHILCDKFRYFGLQVLMREHLGVKQIPIRILNKKMVMKIIYKKKLLKFYTLNSDLKPEVNWLNAVAVTP